MKTIEISEEMYNKLIELGKEMTTQDPRATRMPHMFQIRDWKKVYDFELNGDTRILVDRSDSCEVETFEELKDYLESSEIDFDGENLKKLWEDKGGYDLGEWLEEHCSSLELCSYTLEAHYTNSFLTAKAANDHLKANYYHYHPKADVYLNHAWRNSEAELVSEFLCGLVGSPLHT